MPMTIGAPAGTTIGWVGALRGLGEVKSSAFFSLLPQAASGSTSSKPTRDAVGVNLRARGLAGVISEPIMEK